MYTEVRISNLVIPLVREVEKIPCFLDAVELLALA